MIYFFTKGTQSAGSSRHRAFLLSEQLNIQGTKSVVITPPVFDKKRSRFLARMQYLKTIFGVKKNDTIILQTTIFNKLFIICISIVKLFRCPQVVFDFDDALYLHNPRTTIYLTWLADKITVSSHELRNWVQKKNKPVYILPNLIDTEKSDPYVSTYEHKEKVTIGWIGGAPSSIPNLLILVPVFKELVKKNVPFTFRLIGTLGSKSVEHIFDIKGLDVEFIDKLAWQETGAIQKANQSFDIGLAPLVDWPVNRARCSLKVLDYMSLGLPVVCSAVGENNHFIQNNKTGLLAHSTEEWVSHLERLIADVSLRKTLGTQAREHIQKRYSYQSCMQDYISFITT